MFTNLIAHERTPAHRDDSTMPFGPRRGGFINAADRVFEEAGRSTRRQWNNAKRSISFTARSAP